MINSKNTKNNQLIIGSIIGFIFLIIGFIIKFPKCSTLGLAIITICFFLYYLRENVE